MLNIYQVDAFTNDLFRGNPAAVVMLETELNDKVMQDIAAENNLSETAFVLPNHDEFNIRWFTPTVEVNLCGHATLASAHVIFNHLNNPNKVLTFSSKSGLLDVRKDEDILYLDFPVDDFHSVEIIDEIKSGLKSTPIELYKGRDDYLAIFEDEESIRSISPNLDVLSKIETRGVIVSSQGKDVDFVSRFFAPRAGIPEDPVTGSAHTTLTPYWSRKLNKITLKANQLSQRGGELICMDKGSRIEIGGCAKTYLVGGINC